MGGTDFIDNPGPFLHRSSRKVPYMGVLSAPTAVKPPATAMPLPPLPEGIPGLTREAAVQAYADRLDALKHYAEAQAAEVEAAAVTGLVSTGVAGFQAEAAAKASLPVPPLPNRSGPFEPIHEPLYPQIPAGEGDGAGIRTPRWRGG